MHHAFWKILGAGVAAAVLLLTLGGRFNLVSTIFGTSLALLALSIRLEPGAGMAEQAARATVAGLCLLLAVGRLLEPVWKVVPLVLNHELVASWAALSVAAWFLARRA